MLANAILLPGLSAVLALAIALVICLNARFVGRHLGVMDHPDGTRKRHSHATPQVGGLAIMLSLAVSVGIALLSGQGTEIALLFNLLLCGTGVALIGFIDDQSSTRPLGRVVALIVFLLIAFVIDPSLIAPQLNWVSFEPTALPLWGFSLLMIVAMVGLVNAVNMADGQNGIVAGMFVVWALCLMLVTAGDIAFSVEILFGASLIVLLFNLRGRLFLGDCGTYGVTFVIGLMAIMVHAKYGVPVETIVVWFFIPVMDCLRLLISRPLRGRSPFEGDRDHLHHRLEDKLGRNFGLVTYLSVVALSSVVASLAPHLSLVCVVALTAFYFSFAWLTDSDETAAMSAARLGPRGDAGLPQRLAVGDNVVALTGTEARDRGQNRAG